MKRFINSPNVSSDFADWVEDMLGEYIDTVVKEKKSNPGKNAIAGVMSIVEATDYEQKRCCP